MYVIAEVNPKRYFHSGGKVLELRIEVSHRISHHLSTAVFKIFLQEVLGYQHVKVVKESEDTSDVNLIVHRLSGPLNSVS
jgi:hypothetical protein